MPKPAGIEGPVDICPGATNTYIGKTSESGGGFEWIVTGGTAGDYDGYSIEVTWDATGPYSLVLKQSMLSSPFCTSDTIQLNLVPKALSGPLTITGPTACINTLKNYSASPAQHPEAKYVWQANRLLRQWQRRRHLHAAAIFAFLCGGQPDAGLLHCGFCGFCQRQRNASGLGL